MVTWMAWPGKDDHFPPTNKWFSHFHTITFRQCLSEAKRGETSFQRLPTPPTRPGVTTRHVPHASSRLLRFHVLERAGGHSADFARGVTSNSADSRLFSMAWRRCGTPAPVGPCDPCFRVPSGCPSKSTSPYTSKYLLRRDLEPPNPPQSHLLRRYDWRPRDP